MSLQSTQEDLISIVESALHRDSMISATLNSFDHFVSHGIEQIAKDVFELKYELDAKDTIERDTTIEKYALEVVINDVRVSHPEKYDHGAQQHAPMFPNEALLKDLTYCSGVYVDTTLIAKAFHKNGTITTEKVSIDNTMICKLPTMVKSRMCNTYSRSNEALIQLDEDPSDLGGYFLVKGNQYIIINMESLKYNESREHTNEGYKNELCRADIISKPGDAFENSYSCVVKLLSNHSLVVNLSMAQFKDIDVPFFLLFRGLGVYSAKEIISYITYSFDDSDVITKQMLNILERALTNTYSEMNQVLRNEVASPNKRSEMGKQATVNVITNKDDALQVLTRCIKVYDVYKTKLRSAGQDDALNIERFLLNRLDYNLDMRFLPHIGLHEGDRKKKAAYLGHIIHRLLLVHLRVLPVTDRDSYKNKRINDAGMSYSRVFKTQFNFMVVQKLRRQFGKDFKNNSFVDVNLHALFKSAIKPEDFEKALMNSIVSGDKTLTVNKLTYKNRLSSQQLHHKNKLNVITTLRSIDTPDKGNSAKSSERAMLLRQVHPTGTGYICGITSADTGNKVGMSKQLSVSADITSAGSSEVLKHIVGDDPHLIKISTLLHDMTVISKNNLHKVFVNGDWIGCVEDFRSFLQTYRQKRRIGEIHHFTTVSHSIIANEIQLWVDSGRLIRPLLIVRNNMDDHHYTHDKFKQWIDLTDDHLKKLRDGAIDIDDLAQEGIIEYISPEEHENLYIAFEFDRFKMHQNDPLHRYTHVDIPQGNMGLVALTSVFANHNQAARIVFQTNQVKQTNSWALKNWSKTAHKDHYQQIYNEDPLVSTFAYRHIPPMGTNAIVAISIYGGYNQEDSLIVNRSSVDRGMFDAAHLTYEKIDVEQNEIIGKPDPTNTADIKSYCNYEKLVNGIIPVGTFVQEGDCLVGKVAKLQKGEMKDPNITYTDRSMVYRNKEPAYVWNVIQSANHDDRELIKIVFKTFRSIEIGCKFCLTSNHEVLTRTGWLSIADMTPEHQIATMSTDGDFVYEYPSEVHQFKHQGLIYKASNASVDCEVTLDHNMFAKCDETGLASFRLIPVKLLLEIDYRLKNAIMPLDQPDHLTFKTPNQLNVKMDDWLLFLGIYLCEGHIDLSSMVRITPHKQETMDALMTVLPKLQLKYNIYPGTPNDVYIRGNWQSPRYIGESMRLFGKGGVEKHFPDYVWDLNMRQSRILLDAMTNVFAGDDTTKFYCGSRALADGVQRLALHCGIGAKVSTVGRPAGLNTDALRVSFYCNKTTQSPWVRTKHAQLIDYDGMVYCPTVTSGVFLTRMNGKVHWTGNSSRSGQKGVAGFLYDESDLPTTKDGIRPDLIFNPLSLITRMTTGVIFEGILAKLAAHTGTCPEATMFKKLDTDNIANTLEAYGFNRNGTERLYNGMTGQYMEAEIFIAPLMYQTLQKYTIDTVYANSISPTDALTRQPLHGKKLGGALKLGSMETGCLSVSSVNFLQEKTHDHSDGIDTYVCDRCSSRAVVVNEEMKIYKCNNCGDLAYISKIKSSHTSQLFLNELQGMSVGTKVHIKKPVFEVA
jgi:DNA-directed RNA polymerase beta subunit